MDQVCAPLPRANNNKLAREVSAPRCLRPPPFIRAHRDPTPISPQNQALSLAIKVLTKTRRDEPTPDKFDLEDAHTECRRQDHLPRGARRRRGGALLDAAKAEEATATRSGAAVGGADGGRERRWVEGES